MLALLMIVIHVLAVFWLVAGIVGRDVCYWRAARAGDLVNLKTLVSLAGFFEGASVRPMTLVVLVTGLAAAFMRGYPVVGLNGGGGPYWVHAALGIYLSIVPVIVFVFLPKGRLYRVALAEAESRGEVTAALRNTIEDPVVGAARTYELVMVGVLTYLMVVQPF